VAGEDNGGRATTTDQSTGSPLPSTAADSPPEDPVFVAQPDEVVAGQDLTLTVTGSWFGPGEVVRAS
jgi:hypothetical protein